MDRFPSRVTLAFDPAIRSLSIDGQDASDLLSGEAKVWARGLRFSQHANNDVTRYVLDESADLLQGVFWCSPPSAWMSHPSAIANASYKVSQLQVAARLGFKLPKTVITNDMGTIRSHLLVNPVSISKPVTGRLITVEGRHGSVYTAPLELSRLREEDDSTIVPFCAQERLVGEDVRVTVIGNRCYAVAIKTKTRGTDWRLADDDDVEYQIITLPPQVQTMVLDLIKIFALRYGAVDLYYSRGSYYFLEA